MKLNKSAIVYSAVFALLLTACSSSSEDSASDSFPTEDLTLNISWWGEQEAPGAQKWLEESIALYQEKYPNVTINHTLQTTDGLLPAFEAAAAAQAGPDIQYFWGAIYSQQPGWDGHIAPISDYLSKDELSNYINAEVESGFQGKIWTAPWYVNPSFPLLVRKDILAANGLAVPSTWDDLMKVCDVLSAKKITTLAGGVKDGWFGGWIYSVLGGQSLDSQADVIDAVVGNSKFTEPKHAEWWSKLEESRDRKCWNNDINSLELYQAQQRFVDGKAAMTFTAGPDAPNFVTKAGGDEKVTIIAMPAWTDGPLAGKMGTTSHTFGITKWSKYPQVAADFIKFTHTTERLNAWYAITGSMPADSRFDVSQVTSASTKALFESALDGAPYIESFIPAQLDADAIFKNVQLLLAGKVNANQAAADTQAIMERLRVSDRKLVENFTAWSQ